MTHDMGMALVPLSIPRPDRPEWVHTLMRAYEDYFFGETHWGTCSCIDPFHELAHMVNKQVADMGVIRYAFLTVPEGQRPPWRDFLPAVAWQRGAEKVVRQRNAVVPPDANCQDCHGTGLRETSTNFANLAYETYDVIGIDEWNTVYSIEAVRPEIEKQYIQHMFTPDGVWHSEYFKSPKIFSEWKQDVQRLLDSYPDHEVIVFEVNM